MYPVTLDPPSFSGGDHSKSADDLVQSVTWGNGGPGGAGKNQYTLVFVTIPWHFGKKIKRKQMVAQLTNWISSSHWV